LDCNSLQITDSARRIPGEKPIYTDITYLRNTHNEGIPVFLHVEQERKIDPTMVERILSYNLGQFVKHRRQKQPNLPIIANFVLYNDLERQKYPYQEDIYAYFSTPWMAKILMNQFFGLINLNSIGDSTLVHHSPSGMMEILLKRASDNNFLEWLKKDGTSLSALSSQKYFSSKHRIRLTSGRK